MATGMLKFSPNNTVYIDLDLENHTANKAVDIDAEGVEWPLCGGGSGAFKIFKATLTNNTDNDVDSIEFKLNNMLYTMPVIAGGATAEIWIPVIGDETTVTIDVTHNFFNVTGDAVLDSGDVKTLIVTGDFASEVTGALT